MMTAPVAPLIPTLSAWFDRIAAAGLRAGVRERMLAHGLLMRLAVRGELPEAPVERLRLLGPLLCASAQQQRDYARMLDELGSAGDSGVPADVTRALSLDSAASVRGAWAAIGLVVVVLLVVAWLVWPVLGGGSDEKTVPSSPAASEPAQPASGGIQIDPVASSSSAFAVSASDIPQPVYVPQRPLQWAAPKSPTWAAPLRVGLAVVGVLALGVLGWRVWRHLRLRKPYLEAQEQRDDEVEQRLLRDCAEPERVPIGPAAAVLAPVSRVLRQRTEGDRRTLDVRATITASIRQRGRVLQPVWRTAQQTPEYLALVERAGAGDHQARYHEAVVEALRSRGVTIELFFYRQSPEHGCWRLVAAADEADDGVGGFRRAHDRVSVATLLARFPQHRLLVFGDAGGALDPDTGESQPWTVPARLFAQRAWFTPRPVANWGRAEHWVSEAAGLDVLLLPMEDAALGTLADWLASGRARLVQHPQAPHRYPPLLQADELDWAARRVAPPPEVLARLMVELRSYLGPQRMRWLAACAVFPTLAWPLTLMLGRRVFDRDGDDGVRALGVATLGALPWFRYGRLPNWLRGPLLDELSADEAARLRDELLQRLEHAVTPSNGEVSAPDRSVLARVSRLKLRAWLRGRHGALARDLLMVRFLEPALASKLVQRLPEVFRRWLFRDGSPLRGLRPVVEALLVLPLLAGVAALPGVWDRVGPGTEMVAVAAQQWPAGAGAVKAFGVSADGWLVCTRSADDTVRRWQASTGAAIVGDGWCAESAESTRAIRPDGLQVAQFANGRITLTTVVARSNTVSAAVVGRPGAVLTNQATATSSTEWAQAGITAITYSPDGRQLASTGADGRVIVWDAITAKQLKTLATGTTAWHSVAYSTDGQRILAADAAGRLQVWDVLTGELVTAVSAPTLAGGDIHARFAADGSALFAAGKDGQVHRWGAAPPQAVAVLGCVTTDAVPRVDADARTLADRLVKPLVADKLPALAPVAYTPAMWQTLGHGTAQQIPAKREVLVPANQPEALSTAQTLAAWLSQETPTPTAWTVRTSEAALSMPTISTCDVPPPVPLKSPEPQLDPVAWPQAAADAARNSQLQAALNAVFSTNRASRVQATQKIIADADLVSDLLPMALQRAWLIESGAASGAGSNDARSRVIQTLALAQAATPVTQQWNALAIYRLLDSLKDNGALAETESAALRKILLAAKGKKPLVYLQIADEKQRPAAVKLQARLKKLGFDAPGVEYVGDKAPDQPELRVRGRSDQALARWLAQTQVKSAGLAATAVVGLSNAEAAVDTYELWFSKESSGAVLKVGTRFRDCADDTCPWMVVIPAGKFQMGSMLVDGGSESNERPLHDVIINRSLAVMEAELNRGQFSAFVRDNGYDIIKNGCHVWRGDKYELALDRNWKNPGYEQTDEHPVVCVSWIDAQAYAKWLSAKTGKYYRLLSESEWEYSARANSRKRTKFYFGDFDSDICKYANSADLSIRGKYLGWTFSDCVDGYLNTAPIKSFSSPNLFGLHDMLGNVWEWVEDCWHGDYVGAPRDGAVWRGSCEGDRRVIRGGGWGDIPKNIRSANRNGDSLNLRDDYTGFRLVREINFPSSSVPDSSGVGGDTGSATGGTL